MGMVMRAALYARYSTDRQRETSIGDQLRAAHDRAAREGWPIVATRADEGISGSTPVALRPGGKALLADALAGRFDVLILEGLDRLSRELGEAETMVKRLEHRGLAGNFDRGMSAGGRSYGYRTEDTPHGRRLVIDPAEAEEVRGIFEAYADGHSVRVIAHRLNARGVPTARGGSWGVAALAGSSAKGTGLLRNPLYIGRVIWNRRQWIKDPDTGARRYVDRPQHEWQVRQDEALRIVAQPLWDAVQRRASGAAPRGTRAILADLLGQVTVVHEGREVFAELEDPAQRLLLAAAGGSAESLGGVAGGAIRPGDCAGSGWPEGHFSGAPLGQPVGGVLLGDQQIELPAHRLHAALAAFVL